MKLKTKILEYKKLQILYLDYFFDAKLSLTFSEQTKLCKEVSRLQAHIDRIGNMPYKDTKKEVLEYTIKISSKFPITRNYKSKKVPYIFSTWNPLK